MVDLDLEKITYAGIRRSKETLEFLKGQAKEIFEECRIDWINKHSAEEHKDEELYCEFEREAHKKFKKYIWNWFNDICQQLYCSFDYSKYPPSICGIFESILTEAVASIDLWQISEEIMGDVYSEWEKKTLL